MIIAILSISGLLDDKLWQPLQTDFWNLGQWLKYQEWQPILSSLFVLWVRSIPLVIPILVYYISYNFHNNLHNNLSFVCLEFYKQNCLNVLIGSICYHEQVKNQ